MPKRSLAILITSELHGAHLHAICRSAARKNISLKIHLLGEGVRLCLQEVYSGVLEQAGLSICHKSASILGIADQIETLHPHTLTMDHPRFNIDASAKYIVL